MLLADTRGRRFVSAQALRKLIGPGLGVVEVAARQKGNEGGVDLVLDQMFADMVANLSQAR